MAFLWSALLYSVGLRYVRGGCSLWPLQVPLDCRCILERNRTLCSRRMPSRMEEMLLRAQGEPHMLLHHQNCLLFPALSRCSPGFCRMIMHQFRQITTVQQYCFAFRAHSLVGSVCSCSQTVVQYANFQSDTSFSLASTVPACSQRDILICSCQSCCYTGFLSLLLHVCRGLQPSWSDSC
jgi:hypothetical protein